MRIARCADSGLLVELDDLDAVHGLYTALADAPPSGVIDLVPAARTLLLRLDPDTADPAGIERTLRSTRHIRGLCREAELLRVPVVYDGPDLADVARLTGLDEQEVVRRHSNGEWVVAFGGFAPGFGYLTGEAGLDVPRRTESRTRVPAGAVGLAGRFSGVYPSASPGGWQLIGRTELRMWRIDRDPPALLRPGVRVRFEVAG